MAQVTDRNIGANPTGFDMRTELNNIIGALESDNSGSSEPLNTVAYMKWLDTSNATYYYYKERNHDNTAWVTLFRYTVATKIMEVVSDGVVFNSSSFVSKTGDETIAGVKTFSSFPVTPSSAPTTDYQVANKKYVTDNAGISLATANSYDLGVNQTWQDVTASRVLGTTYTNSTGKPIAISVIANNTTIGSFGVSGSVGGNLIIVSFADGTSGIGYNASIFFIVPPSQTYSVTNSGVSQTNTWKELR